MRVITKLEHNGATLLGVDVNDMRDKGLRDFTEICTPCPFLNTKYCGNHKGRTTSCRSETESWVWVPQQTYVEWMLEK
jgi:hypothetical protein